LKVLFVSTFYGSKYESGAEKSTRIWASLLRRKGIHVSILSFSSSRTNCIDEKFVIFPKLRVPDAVLGGHSILDKYIMKKIRPILETLKLDIVHIQDLFALPIVMPISKEMSISTVVTVRDPLPKKEIGVSSHLYYLITNIWLRQRQPQWLLNLAKADKIVAISKFIKRSLLSLGYREEKIEVIYNPVISDGNFNHAFDEKIVNFVKRLSEKFKILFTAARMHYEKGLDVAIRALHELPNGVRSKFVLILAGDGPYLSFFKSLAKRLGVEKRTIFLGYLSHRTVLEMYKYAYLTLLPSRFEEPLGRTILESMYFGTPVIATNVGGIPELIDDGYNGFLVERDDYKAIADKILYLYKHEKDYLKMCKNAKNFVKTNFNGDNLAEKMIRLYESII